MGRAARKKRRRAILDAFTERRANRSAYATKKWTQATGKPPRTNAVSEATKKSTGQ